jgi:bifunctional DNA-binding transcriptional regulator/antitoxin component of YhaV-PrlF toxin-antitoxin module
LYGQKIVPSLYMSGVWLEALGFKIGDQVSITTRERLLIIEPVQVAEAAPDYQTELKQVKDTLKKLVK